MPAFLAFCDLFIATLIWDPDSPAGGQTREISRGGWPAAPG